MRTQISANVELLNCESLALRKEGAEGTGTVLWPLLWPLVIEDCACLLSLTELLLE